MSTKQLQELITENFTIDEQEEININIEKKEHDTNDDYFLKKAIVMQLYNRIAESSKLVKFSGNLN